MTDHGVRTAALRARSSGDPQDEALSLLARVRAGTLSRERLELAAYSFHGPAVLALTGSQRFRMAVPAQGGGSIGEGWPDVYSWTMGLSQWAQALDMAALLAARCAIRKARRGYLSEADRGVVDNAAQAVVAGIWWVESGEIRHHEAWEASARRAMWVSPAVPRPGWLPSPGDLSYELRARIAVAQVLVGDRPLRRAWSTHLARWALTSAPAPRSLGKCFAGSCSTPAVRYANGHAMCEQHAADYEERQASLRGALA